MEAYQNEGVDCLSLTLGLCAQTPLSRLLGVNMYVLEDEAIGILQSLLLAHGLDSHVGGNTLMKEILTKPCLAEVWIQANTCDIAIC
ncbi:hypothetical protein TSUD_82240 [Trifolium subterraneum]|uniref:Uncharacterized protein n=1 Tax=Trifolium subterraneum TaxID=3900 RepID=A0A2Z6NJ34_TRISU|nr:hypothetical protein TSUD_82240 [Trifolium subterraneum]